MDNRYKLIISGKNIYKEIELSPEMGRLRIGTSSECDVRLKRNLFFAPVEMDLQINQGVWTVLFSDNIYGSVGGSQKFLIRNLSHGDELSVRYQDSDVAVLSMYFMIDFEYDMNSYDLEIDISGKDKVLIGGSPDSDILLNSEYVGTDTLTLSLRNGGVFVRDNGSKYGVYVNGTRVLNDRLLHNLDFFSIASFGFQYKEGKLYTSAENNCVVRHLNVRKISEHTSHFQYPHFNRSTRIQYEVPEDELEILPAVQKPSRQKQNFVLSLVPTLIMLAMTIVLRGIIGGGGVFVIYSAVSMSIGIVTSVISFVQGNKEYKKEYQDRIDTYEQYIEGKKQNIKISRENELRILNLIYEDLNSSISEVEQFGSRLFERSPGDKDFLQIYLGRGRIESVNPVKYTKVEFSDPEDPLANIPEQVAESYKYVDNAPIYSDFLSSCSVGVTGDRRALVQMLKNMTLDVGIRHFYDEVKMVFFLDDTYISDMKWVRWLHNIENPSLDIRNIAGDEESRNQLLEFIYKTLSTREIILGQNQEERFDEHYVVFVTDYPEISTHPMTRYLRDCAKYGFTFVFFSELEENLPQGCGEIIRLYDNENGSIIKSKNGDAVSEFIYPAITDKQARDAALKLGAVVTDEVSLEGELTKNYTMYEMLGILSVDDIDLGENWAAASAYKGLAAPLGIKGKNQKVFLDISDKAGAHGPHGLVAGTTGSGKSEVLQTYILSMSILYHPYEVGFVIIDFKGGGMSNQFKNLPHLIGTITNIDGREIDRSLLSIKAELVRRQELFAQYDVNHINDYIKLYEAGKATVPLPHLIMIVDEFAELKQEYPDFMKELISASRIGRTLGIHLILATQKPAGVVDGQIWSNSKFKLCLKVQTKEDSNEVIKTPLAAEIVEAGRAYFQVGNNEIFELFQSAYSGANVPDGNENKDKIFAVYEKNLYGKKTQVYSSKKEKTADKKITQLQAIVDHVHDYCETHRIEKLPGICLPSLPSRISTEELQYDVRTGNGICVPIGIYDDPGQQRQGMVELDISRDNIYIVGSAQMGKTVLLQSLIYGLIRKYTPDQVQIYIVDCGSMVLKNFENSAHVGGVVLSSDEEKCKNLFKLLYRFMAQRKNIMAGRGVGSYGAYLEAGYTDMPMTVVVIDNMSAFKEYFPEQTDEISALSREAQGVGISFVITTGNSNALNYRTQSNFGTKFALNCNDTNEYSNLFGHCSMTPGENPGRGLIMLDKRVLEFQTAMFGKGDKEAIRNEELKKYIEQRNTQCTAKAVEIPMVPEKLLLKEVMSQNIQAFRTPGVLPIGMDFATVELTNIQLAANGSFTLLGDPVSRDRFVAGFLNMIAQTVIFHNVTAVVIDDKSKKLQQFSKYGFVTAYHSEVADGIEAAEDFYDDVMQRIDDDERDDSHIVLVINSLDVFRKICADKTAGKHMSEAVKNAVEAGAFILFATVDNQPVGFNSSELLKTIKEEKRAILFAQLTECKLFDISGRIKAEPGFDQSMGYLFSGSTYSRIKIFE